MSTLKKHILALREREYSAEELCLEYLSKIEKKDLLYNSFLYVDPDSAVKTARKADEMLRNCDNVSKKSRKSAKEILNIRFS